MKKSGTYEGSVECLYGNEKFTVYYEAQFTVHGESLPATMWEPAEHPELEIDKIEVVGIDREDETSLNPSDPIYKQVSDVFMLDEDGDFEKIIQEDTEDYGLCDVDDQERERWEDR